MSRVTIPARKAEIPGHRDTRSDAPCVNVKRYHSPEWSASRIAEHFKCSESRAEKVAGIVYECLVEDFWRDAAPAALSVAFGESRAKSLKIYSAGRMGGWLYVEGLTREGMTGPEFQKWRKFCRLLESEIAYFETWEFARDMIECNEWAPAEHSPEGERQTIRDDKSAQARALVAFFNIHEELDGKEWDSETIERVADHVRAAGLTIREPEEVENG